MGDAPTRRGPEPPDISEKGGLEGGQPQRSDERLFMQLLAFGGCTDPKALGAHLADAGVTGVVYEDLNDPRGVAVLALSRSPSFFLDVLRPALNAGPFVALGQKPEYTMFGRTYALGYEPDLDEVLFHRPARTVLNPAWPWKDLHPLSAVVQAMRKTQQTALYLDRLGPFFVGRAIWQAHG
jgi:hypothetical protein